MYNQLLTFMDDTFSTEKSKELLGAVVGDVASSFGMPPAHGRFAGATVMTLAVAEWLMSDPGDNDEDTAKRKINNMVHFGVRHFVDLTGAGGVCPGL